MQPQDHDRTPADSTSAGVLSSRRTRHLLAAVLVAWLALVLARTLLVDWFAVPSASMEPTLRPGEVILVDKRPAAVRPGDVVVVDGQSFGLEDRRPWARRLLGRIAGESPGQHLVKRVIATAGQQVRCCDAQGRLLLDGVPLREEYVARGDTPSEVAFSVTVPTGTLWLMGDHRSRSADSRSRLGRPGGGFLPARDVTGHVVQVIWPPGHRRELSALPTPTLGGDR
ncbi:signal peptidase I [Arsenicicoccus dermatophilus]|uniref:signal peptidase I n=1 Tax=Arsenicicoccus dermatophilus TaxID=1076331 RepID=UPI001F4CE63B|nr:signal peptidase I [Arsenicicoccus dermatophilus]